jgi:hypothetical protein
MDGHELGLSSNCHGNFKLRTVRQGDETPEGPCRATEFRICANATIQTFGKKLTPNQRLTGNTTH